MNETPKLVVLTPEEVQEIRERQKPPTETEKLEIQERLGKKVDDFFTDTDIEEIVSRITSDGSTVISKEIHRDATPTNEGTVIDTEKHTQYLVFVVLKNGEVSRWRWSLEKGAAIGLVKEEVVIKEFTPPAQ